MDFKCIFKCNKKFLRLKKYFIILITNCKYKRTQFIYKQSLRKGLKLLSFFHQKSKSMEMNGSEKISMISAKAMQSFIFGRRSLNSSFFSVYLCKLFHFNNLSSKVNIFAQKPLIQLWPIWFHFFFFLIK